MTTGTSATLQAIVDAAVGATGATAGWLLASDGVGLTVIVAAGGAQPGALVGRPAAGGSASYVVESGQPVALQVRAGDAMGEGAAADLLGQRPGSILAVPCSTDDSVAGALEVVDKAGGGPFSFDDVELVSLLGEIAGPALAELGAAAPDVRPPGAIADELRALHSADPARYTQIATVIDALLAQR